MARRGKAGLGKAFSGRGWARRGPGRAGQGVAGHGMARRGEAGHGKAWNLPQEKGRKMTFESVRDDGVPQWRLIYNHITDVDPEIGHIFTHQELRDVLDPPQRKYYYTIVREAAEKLERNNSRTLISVRGQGYRFNGGIGQIGKAESQRDRGKRSIGRAVTVAQRTDFHIMSPEDRKYADQVKGALIALANIAKQHDEKLIKIDEELHALRNATTKAEARQRQTEEAQAATSDIVEDLMRRMADLEKKR